MKFRIISLGKDFADSNRRSLLCQQSTTDELGFITLGAQFHWEISKDSFTPEVEANLQKLVDARTLVERPFRLQEVQRNNPNTGEITTKLVATVQ